MKPCMKPWRNFLESKLKHWREEEEGEKNSDNRKENVWIFGFWILDFGGWASDVQWENDGRMMGRMMDGWMVRSYAD
jgi:hypothetical protein